MSAKIIVIAGKVLYSGTDVRASTMKFQSQTFVFHGVERCVNSEIYLRQAKACRPGRACTLTAPHSACRLGNAPTKRFARLFEQVDGSRAQYQKPPIPSSFGKAGIS